MTERPQDVPAPDEEPDETPAAGEDEGADFETDPARNPPDELDDVRGG